MSTPWYVYKWLENLALKVLLGQLDYDWDKLRSTRENLWIKFVNNPNGALNSFPT